MWMFDRGLFGMRMADWFGVIFFLCLVSWPWIFNEAPNPVDKAMALIVVLIGGAILSEQVLIDWYEEYTD